MQTIINQYKYGNDKYTLFIKSIIYFALAVMWGFYGLHFSESNGVDFRPIVETFSDLRSIDETVERFIYAFYGNTTLIFLVSTIAPSLSEIESTRLLYFTASFFRAYVTLRLLGLRIGIFILLAFQGSLDFNQSRLSLALTIFLLMIYAQKKIYYIPGIALAHMSILPYLLFIISSKRLITIGVTGVFIVAHLILPVFFARYFVPFDHELPMNLFLYASVTFLASNCLRNSSFQTNSHWYLIIFGALIASLVPAGFSPLYIGRVAEMTAMVSLFGLGLHVKKNIRTNSRGRLIYVALCVLITAYQILILNGNIWRFFQ